MKKTAVCAALAILCLLALLMGAQAESCGDGVTWTLENGVLSITGSGAMKDYEVIRLQFDAQAALYKDRLEPWYRQRSEIREIVIGPGVTHIGAAAFFACDKLERVTLPASLTSIGESAFMECTVLREIDLPEGLRTLGDYAFCRCEAIKSLAFPGSAVELGVGVCYQCKSLEEVRLPQGLTEIPDYMFRYDRVLREIDLPSRVARIGREAFFCCELLTEVTLPESAEAIEEGAFYHCVRLRQIHLPARLTGMGESVFEECEALESFSLPAGIEEVPARLLSGCYALAELTIPEGVTAIGEFAIYACHALERAVMPSTLQRIDNGAFNFCSALKALVLLPGVQEIADNILGFADAVTIYCAEGSYAHRYAEEHGIPFSFDLPEDLPKATPAPAPRAELEPVYNNGGDAVEYRGITYYWKYSADSVEETGLMTGFSMRADAVNTLMARDEQGKERVFLTDTGYGPLYIVHDHLMYNSGYAVYKAVRLDGSGSYRLYEKIGILGIDDVSGDMICRRTDSEHWGELLRLGEDMNSTKILNKDTGHDMTYFGIMRGMMYYGIQDGRIVDIHAYDLDAGKDSVLVSLTFPSGYFCGSAYLDPATLYVSCMVNLGGTGAFYGASGLYSVDLQNGTQRMLIDPEGEIMCSDQYTVVETESSDRRLIYFMGFNEALSAHDAAYQPYYTRFVKCLDTATLQISDTEEYLTPEGQFIYREGAIYCRIGGAALFKQVVSARALATCGYPALQDFTGPDVVSVKRFNIVKDRAYFEIQECRYDPEASLGWRDGYRLVRVVLWETEIGSDRMIPLNVYGADTSLPAAAEAPAETPAPTEAPAETPAPTEAPAETPAPTEGLPEMPSEEEAMEAIREALEALVAAMEEHDAEEEQPAVTEAPQPPRGHTVDMETSTFYGAWVKPGPEQEVFSDPEGKSLLFTLPAGTPVLVYAAENGWAHINANGADGYLPLSCLTLEEPAAAAETPAPDPTESPTKKPKKKATKAPTEAPTEAPTQKPKKEATKAPTETPRQEEESWQPYTARTTKKGVNVRKSASQSSDRVTQLSKKGEKVTVLGVETNPNGETWYKIETAKGKQGYIRGDLLERVK